MGNLIHAFKKCCPPDRDPAVYLRGAFSINGTELYEVVDVPEWGWHPPPPLSDNFKLV